jgi:hypothetical protein
MEHDSESVREFMWRPPANMVIWKMNPLQAGLGPSRFVVVFLGNEFPNAATKAQGRSSMSCHGRGRCIKAWSPGRRRVASQGLPELSRGRLIG